MSFISGGGSGNVGFTGSQVTITGVTFAPGVTTGKYVGWDNSQSRYDVASPTGIYPIGVADVTNSRVLSFGESFAGQFTGLTVNTVYFLDTGGNITITPGVIKVGHAKTPTAMYVDIDTGGSSTGGTVGAWQVNTITTNLNLTSINLGQIIVCDTTSNPITISPTFPLTSQEGKQFAVINFGTGTNLVTVSSASGTGIPMSLRPGQMAYFTVITANSIRHDSDNIGQQTVNIYPGFVKPSLNSGCSIGAFTGAANQPCFDYLAFDDTTDEYAEFRIDTPDGVIPTTLNARFVCQQETSGAGGFVFGLQAVAVNSSQTTAVNFGTVQTSVITVGTQEINYTGILSTPITVAGTPGRKTTVYFRVSRVTSNPSDNKTGDAWLKLVQIFPTYDITTDSAA